MDKETLSLPNTPRASFRQTVRKSLRKLKRKKKQNKKKSIDKPGAGDPRYEVTLEIKEPEDDNIYDIVQPEDITLESNHDEQEPEDEDITIKEHYSRKPTFLSDKLSGQDRSEQLHNMDVDTLIREKDRKLFPRGPLGELLRHKSQSGFDLDSVKGEQEAEVETADEDVEEEADKNVEIEISDKENINEECKSIDSLDEESNEEARKTLLDEG